jgi:hypothetical protein
MPHYFPIGGGSQFAVLYETNDGWWTGSSMASRLPGAKLLRILGFNAPGGINVDVVDATNGKKQTCSLDCDSARSYPFPQAGKVVIPQTGDANSFVPAIKFNGGNDIIPYAGDAAAVWNIPPRRSYRAVALTSALLAAMAAMWHLAPLGFRAMLGRRRGQQEVSPPAAPLQNESPDAVS